MEGFPECVQAGGRKKEKCRIVGMEEGKRSGGAVYEGGKIRWIFYCIDGIC